MRNSSQENSETGRKYKEQIDKVTDERDEFERKLESTRNQMNKMKGELKNSGSAYDNNTGRNVSFNQTGTSTSSNKQSESEDNISNTSDADKYRQQGKTSRPRVKARVSEIDNDAMNFATAMANAEMTRTSVKFTIGAPLPDVTYFDAWLTSLATQFSECAGVGVYNAGVNPTEYIMEVLEEDITLERLQRPTDSRLRQIEGVMSREVKVRAKIDDDILWKLMSVANQNM